MSDIPAGWQPDPRGRHEYRYWDGSQWTDHVSDQGQVSTDPVSDTTPPGETPAADDDAKSAIFTPESESAAAAPESEPEPVASTDPEPAATPDPEPVAATEPEPTAVQPSPAAESDIPASTPPAGAAEPTHAASSAPPGSPTVPATAQTEAKAAAQDIMQSRSPELATILSAVVPGSGHLYLGDRNTGLAVGLLAATVAAVVISHFSFLMFLIGFVLWAGAAAFALTDLRGGVRGIEDTTLPKNIVGILLIGAGALLIISLLLPYYRLSAPEIEAFGQTVPGASGSASGFQSFEFIDIVLLIIGVASIVGGAASLGLGPVTSAELPRWLPTAIAIGGAVATVLILFRMFVDPAPDLGDVDVGRAFGIWIALWSAMVLLIANLGVLRSLSNKQGQAV